MTAAFDPTLTNFAARCDQEMSIPQPEVMSMTHEESEAYQRLMFLFKHALKQLGPGGLVITDEDRKHPAPMFVKRESYGATRYVTYTNGS